MQLLVLLAVLSATGCVNSNVHNWNPIMDYTWITGTIFTAALFLAIFYQNMSTKKYWKLIGISLATTTIAYSFGLMYWQYDVISAVSAIVMYLVRGIHKETLTTDTIQATPVAAPEHTNSLPEKFCARCNQVTIGEDNCGLCGNAKNNPQTLRKRLYRVNMS